jgi:hypothetical protein
VEEKQDNRVLVVTSRGVTVECLPIVAALEELEAQYNAKRQTIPFVSYDVAGVAVPFDDKTIAREGTTEEEKQAYADRKRRLAEIDNELAERRFRLLAISGVRVVDMPPDEEWIPRHEFVGFTVPTDPIQRQYHYFRTEVVGVQDDAIKMVVGIYKAAGVATEVLDQIEARFRAAVGRPGGRAVIQNTETPGKAPRRKKRGVVE